MRIQADILGDLARAMEAERRAGQRLRFVYRRGQPSLLVADGRVSEVGRDALWLSKTGRGRGSVVVFLLVPQVTIRKPLGLLAAAFQRDDQLPNQILRELQEREASSDARASFDGRSLRCRRRGAALPATALVARGPARRRPWRGAGRTHPAWRLRGRTGGRGWTSCRGRRR